MAKHLAEKKKPQKETVKQIHIPQKKSKPAPKRVHRKKAESALMGAMLNKTLDRSFNPSDAAMVVMALALLGVAYFLPTTGLIRLLSFIVPFLIAGYNYLYEAFQEAFMGIVLGRELIVTVACLMAFCGGAYFGAAANYCWCKNNTYQIVGEEDGHQIEIGRDTDDNPIYESKWEIYCIL